MLERCLPLGLQEELQEPMLIDRVGLGSGAFLLCIGGLILVHCARRFGQFSHLGIADEERSLGSWAGREVLELCAVALALLAFIGLSFRETIESKGAGAFVLNEAWILLLGAVAIGLAWQADGARGLRALGIRCAPLEISDRPQRGALGMVLLGAFSYVLWVPFLLGVYVLWPVLAELVGIDMQPQQVLEDILNLEGAAQVFVVLLAALVGPFLEELVFRGFLQPVLVRSVGALAGIVITSILFALVHGVVVFLPIFVFSLLLGWVQLRTRCLWASWCVHAMHNSLILSLAL